PRPPTSRARAGAGARLERAGTRARAADGEEPPAYLARASVAAPRAATAARAAARNEHRERRGLPPLHLDRELEHVVRQVIQHSPLLLVVLCDNIAVEV